MKNCTCEYCCFVRDEEDDKQMEEEYCVASYFGEKIFHELSVGNKIQFYSIPYEDRKSVFSDDLEYIQSVAIKTFQCEIVSKKKEVIIAKDLVGDNEYTIRYVECKMWYVHKIK